MLVQQYIFPDETFRVFRKPTGPGEKFTVSPGEVIEPELFWIVSPILFMTGEELGGMSELFALVYVDREHSPIYRKPKVLEGGKEIIAVAT